MAPKKKSASTASRRTPDNGDRNCKFSGGFVGLGSFHKTLAHDDWGQVDADQFKSLTDACDGTITFDQVEKSSNDTAALTNPRAGLARDRLVHEPKDYEIESAPDVLSSSTAAEMTELYWMALLRDVSLDQFEVHPDVIAAAKEITDRFKNANDLKTGEDLPGALGASRVNLFSPSNLFRLGLPGEEIGPLVSQFFIRDVHFGTQVIDARQWPYRAGIDHLTNFEAWLHAQRTGKDMAGQTYSQANEDGAGNFDADRRHISTLRDLARFVNKDALHQAYFNAALLLLSGGAKWTPLNPYSDPNDAFNNGMNNLSGREAGFGVLGGPHILALVSEVATRALKVVWFQKWQTHLRLRPEAYGGLVHVQSIGAPAPSKRAFGLPAWVATTEAAKRVRKQHGSLLLPMAYTPGSPTHPAYGAGHATVAGACVTILKAYFQCLDSNDQPLALRTLTERTTPHGPGAPMQCFSTGVEKPGGPGRRTPLPHLVNQQLTIEGELNKLASNVAMGRSMGGVHWRTDNTRSLLLGEALAAEILFGIAEDVAEIVEFKFRSFARKADGQPKIVIVTKAGIKVDGATVTPPASKL